jgi:hypothetical protein
MSRGRNPRRACDEDGGAILPATVGSKRTAGLETVTAFRNPWGHQAGVPLAPVPDEPPVRDTALKVRCSAYGSKRIMIHVDVDELYAKESP